MRKQQYLIQLIKTLTPNERRYFKLLSNAQSGEKKYLQLFDALEDKEEYNATELSEKLGLSPTQLASEKRYLIQVLLKSLRFYKEELNSDNHIGNMIADAAELHERGLYHFAVEVLDKAIAKAEETNNVYLMPKLISRKFDYLTQLEDFSEIEKLKQDFDKSIDTFTEYFELIWLRTQVIRFEQSRNGSDTFAQHNHQLFRTDPGKLLSVKTQIQWFGVMNRYYLMVEKDLNKVLQIARQAVAFYESNTELKDANPYQYYIALISVVTSEGQAGNYENEIEAADRCLQIFKTADRTISRHDLADMVSFCNYAKAWAILQLHRYNEAVQLLEERYNTADVQSGYVKYSLSYDYACALFHTGQLKKSLELINELITISPEHRIDMQIMLRALMLMVQCELGNYELIPYQVKAAKAWMKRRELVSQELEAFFSMIYPMAKADKDKRTVVYKKILAAVENKQLPEMELMLHLKSWVASKV